jgi:cell division protein FtsB
LKIIYIALAIVILILQVRLLSSDGGVGELISLQKNLDDLQSSTQAIETIARQKLGMIGEDEAFIKIIELPKSSPKTLEKQTDMENGETPDASSKPAP